MGLENADFIPEMVDTNPLGTDPKSEGDDHLNLIKRCVQNSFPSFVGNQTTPKFVTLTEDELNDAGLQSRVNTWSATQVYSVSPRTNNDVAYNSRNAANTASRELLKLDAADILQHGNINHINEYHGGQAFNSHAFYATGVLYGEIGNQGVRGANAQGAMQEMGWLRPALISANGDITIDVDLHKGVVIQLGAPGNFNVTIPVLQGQMTWTMTNRSGAEITIIEAATSVRFLAGGAEIAAPLTMANNSVVTCYMVNSSFCSVWGNGIS